MFVIGPPRSPVIKELIRLQELERKKERATKPSDTAASRAARVRGPSTSGKPARAAKKAPARKKGRK